MSNPFIIALKTNPGKFLNDLTSVELTALGEACVRVLERRGKEEGDLDAPRGLQAIYRSLNDIEI